MIELTRSAWPPLARKGTVVDRGTCRLLQHLLLFVMRIHQLFCHVANPQTPDTSTANVTSVSSGSSSSALLSVCRAQQGLGHVEALSGSCANRIVFACVANSRLFCIVATLSSGSANFRT